MVGIQRAALHSTRGVVPAFSDLLTTRTLGTYALFVLAFGVLLVVGLALCLLPGVLVAFYLQLSPYYIIDRGMGVRAAMAASRRSISANPSAAVMMLLVNTAAFVLGGALFGILTLVTLPIATVFTAHLYRQFNHEPVA
jgi:uncharacterized membrane protein